MGGGGSLKTLELDPESKVELTVAFMVINILHGSKKHNGRIYLGRRIMRVMLLL